jgi:hypothetical protein
MNKIIILSPPRSGSSILARLIESAGYKNFISKNSFLLSGSEYNKNGYFEDIAITLLNDQLIRMCYGSDYSFLHTPSFDSYKKINLHNNISFKYNLENLFIPSQYKEKIFEYTGNTWDSWGITRMLEGEKWHKCYNRYNIDNYTNIIDALSEIVTSFNNNNQNIIIKDPRLALIMPVYKFDQKIKILYIKRQYKNIKKSILKHYGPNLFTKKYIFDTKYCSNYFNYLIKYQSFRYYIKTYNKIIEESLNKYESLTIDYEKLNKKSTIDKINYFIGSSIDSTLIK